MSTGSSHRKTGASFPPPRCTIRSCRSSSTTDPRSTHTREPLFPSFHFLASGRPKPVGAGRGVFHELFGSYPAGLWPSEGSISPAVLEMAAGTGFRWAATDEILLARAFGTTVREEYGRDTRRAGLVLSPLRGGDKERTDPRILPGPLPVRPDRLRILALECARCGKQFYS